ncbi:hypothetical protein FRC01_003754 [Tulasnella sp. 417]|nr:hypothetical protein FRC01_003754 [Tulasnella sp. 417]
MLTWRPRQVQIVLVLAAFVLFAFILQFRSSLQSQFQYYTCTSKQETAASQASLSPSTLFDPSTPFLRRHIAFATSVEHPEVYSPLAWTVHSLMSRQPPTQPTSVKIYAFQRGFHILLKKIGMLPMDIMLPEAQLSKDIRSSSLYEDDMGAMIDLVVLGTCEQDLEKLGPDLLKAWDERPQDKKFMLVCSVHNPHTTPWFKHISKWSRRGAFRVVAISDHVVNYYHSMFNDWADSKDPAQRLSLYEYIKVDAYYAVSNFTNFPLRPKTYLADVPCSAVLQGLYESGRRDYDRVFADLLRLLKEDVRAWGYTWSLESKKYIADAAAPNPPFVLHLVGKGKITVPAELQDVVVLDVKLDTVPFYELIQSTDILLPGFAPGGEYLKLKGSSTVHTAIMNHVPLIVTRAMLESYPYLTVEGTILRPFALSEMEVIGLFRGAKVTAQAIEGSNGGSKPLKLDDLSSPDVSPELANDVRRMLSQGWKRSYQSFDKFKQDIWKKNEEYVGRLLRDL